MLSTMNSLFKGIFLVTQRVYFGTSEPFQYIKLRELAQGVAIAVALSVIIITAALLTI